jgi:hypothetical protein
LKVVVDEASLGLLPAVSPLITGPEIKSAIIMNTAIADAENIR